LREPDRMQIDAARARCERPFAIRNSARGGIEPVREALSDLMWHKVGIIRDAAGLRAALSELDAIETDLDAAVLADQNRAFNLSWHDWMNLKNLVEVSRVIARAAAAREDSRGAHFREDFPQAGPLEASTYTSAGIVHGRVEIAMHPVAFTRVRPGQSLLAAA
jgi:fumarate reductase flavoprotein subunit